MNQKLGRKNRKKNVQNLEIVCVVWDDAALGTHDGPIGGADGKTVENYTLGFLDRKNRDVVVVMVEASPGTNTVRWDYTIPRKLVRAIISLSDFGTLQDIAREREAPPEQEP